MPPTGFFTGGFTTLDDAKRVARHLSGSETLAGSQLRLADLDGDGYVTASDLLLILRLVSSDQLNIPLPLPRISSLMPVFARYGGQVEIYGFGFGADINPVEVVLCGGNTTLSINPETVEENKVTFTLPTSTPLIGARASIEIRLLRNGVLSNAAPLEVTDRPILASVDPEAAAVSQTINLAGAGFGNDAALVQVRFGTTSVPPVSVSDEAISVTVPGGLEQEVEVIVVVNGRESNPQGFAPVLWIGGVVTLPVASSLRASHLSISTAAGETAPIRADGSFELMLTSRRVVELQLLDTGGRMILGAIWRHGVSSQVDALSTAVWLVFSFAGGLGLRDEQIEPLLMGLRNAPAATALAQAIMIGHADRPVLSEQLEHDPAVREKLQLALAAGAEICRTIILG